MLAHANTSKLIKDPFAHLLGQMYITLNDPQSIGISKRTLERHPFSGLVDSAGELLHTP
jgi:hypothetical protein